MHITHTRIFCVVSNPDFETIDWQFHRKSGVGNVVLNRPESLNALSTTLRHEFVDAFEAFERLEHGGNTVQVVVLEGSGDDAFCAGADRDEFERGGPKTESFESENLHSVIERFPAPVIAKIDGYCLGGGLGLAMESDFRFASQRSTFGLPEVDLGIAPDFGMLRHLTALVGPSRAKELGMTGEQISAERAEREGLVDYVHPHEELDHAVEEFVDTLSEKPTAPTRVVKDLVNIHQGSPGGETFSQRAESRLREAAHRES